MSFDYIFHGRPDNVRASGGTASSAIDVTNGVVYYKDPTNVDAETGWISTGAPPSTNLLMSQFGPHADGVTDDSTAFNVAQATLSEVWLDAGKSYFIGSNVTFNSDIRFLAGAKIVVGAGVTFTMNGVVYATPNRQCFVCNPATFSQVAADSMNRADENPMSNGGNWVEGSTSGSTNAGQLVSHLYEPTAANTLATVVWTGAGFNTANHYSEITIKNSGTNNGNSNNYAIVRGAQAPASLNCYIAWTSGAGASVNRYIYRYVNGTGLQLYHDTVTVTNGDKLRLAAMGSNISLYYNGTLVTTVVDTQVTSGQPGMALFDTVNITNAQLSGWTGGNFLSQGVVKFGPAQLVVYAEWFGAKRDGATDDSNAIQLAMNAISTSLGFASLPTVAATLQLLQGIYAVANTLTLNASYVNLMGAGPYNTQIFWKGLATNDVLQVAGTGTTVSTFVAFNRIGGFQIERNAQGTGSSSDIRVNNAIAIDFRDIYLFSSVNGMYHDVNAQHMYYFNIQVGGGAFATTTGFNFNSSSTFNSTFVNRCLANNCTTGFGITGAGIADLYLFDCEDAGSNVGFSVTSTSQTTSWINDNVHLIHCTSDGSRVSGFVFTNVFGNAAYIDMDSCYAASAGNTGPLIDIENSVVQVRGCDVRAQAVNAGGILVNGANCAGCIISNNQVIAIGTGTLAYLIKLNSVVNVVVSANVGIGQSSTNKFNIGIQLVASLRNAITSNQFQGFGTTGLSYDATSNNNASTGNVVDTTNITTAKSDLGTGNTAGV